MSQLIEQLGRKLWMLIGRGRISAPPDDSGAVQTVQVRLGEDETRDSTRRLAEYGFASSPPVGSDAVVLFIGGDRGRGVVVATNHQASRLRGLQPGEAAIFDDQGQSIWIKRSGIVIEAAGRPVSVTGASVLKVDAADHVELDTPQLRVSGSILAGGDVTDNAASGGKSMSAMRDVYSGHDHPVVNVQPGQASVTSGKPNQKE